jgi:hypothetical protein
MRRKRETLPILARKTSSLEMDIIENEREGYGKSTAKELQGYISDLEWAKTALPDTAVAAQRDADRDIAWCKRRLKSAH